MTKLFWIAWILDLLFLIFNLWATGFRSGFGAGLDINTMLTVGLIVVLLSSLLCKIYLTAPWIATVVAALPLLAVLVWYIVDRIQNP